MALNDAANRANWIVSPAPCSARNSRFLLPKILTGPHRPGRWRSFRKQRSLEPTELVLLPSFAILTQRKERERILTVRHGIGLRGKLPSTKVERGLRLSRPQQPIRVAHEAFHTFAGSDFDSARAVEGLESVRIPVLLRQRQCKVDPIPGPVRCNGNGAARTHFRVPERPLIQMAGRDVGQTFRSFRRVCEHRFVCSDGLRMSIQRLENGAQTKSGRNRTRINGERPANVGLRLLGKPQ